MPLWSLDDWQYIERQIVTVQPHLKVGDGNWEIEFFDSDRYNSARDGRSP